MSKWEKVAWMEIGVTALATLLVFGAYPWHGIQATKLYALLGVVVLTYPFMAWQRGQEVPTGYLHALVWIQFAIFIGVTAVVTVIGYRRTGYAA